MSRAGRRIEVNLTAKSSKSSKFSQTDLQHLDYEKKMIMDRITREYGRGRVSQVEERGDGVYIFAQHAGKVITREMRNNVTEGFDHVTQETHNDLDKYFIVTHKAEDCNMKRDIDRRIKMLNSSWFNSAISLVLGFTIVLFLFIGFYQILKIIKPDRY
jgi:hypothetical protein